MLTREENRKLKERTKEIHEELVGGLETLRVVDLELGGKRSVTHWL